MQVFKGDALELKMIGSGGPILDAISTSLDECFNGIYGCIPMGEFLFDEKRVPLTNALKRAVFISAFKQIFEAWSFCGRFESYIVVFKKIFGEDAVIEFTVPGPGKLNIDITAGLQESPLIAREIVDNAFVLSNLVDYDDDNIVATSVAGIETESELSKMLFSMVPNGIYTEVSLTLS